MPSAPPVTPPVLTDTLIGDPLSRLGRILSSAGRGIFVREVHQGGARPDGVQGGSHQRQGSKIAEDDLPLRVSGAFP